ncbi:hypothetical protein K432DRAFT_431999 [Lepidopterella palustris CBS 459.81]|uniref:KANL3/Tex30 alpha/beta hydrolase-like domain-containing protein n=1 Tax=Lepidopterella palustris CBS 459.81 TaxID=1314670 RepID=A0A8E2JJJ4_9PEZI|nr:hypothetical protein K432DRAFT_431999 [Lepidopterella palustris CBS 459.81]
MSQTVQLTTPSVTSVKSTSVSIARNPKALKCLRSGNTNASLIFTHGSGGTIFDSAMVNFTAGFTAVLSMLAFQGNVNLASRVKGFQTVIAHEKPDGSAFDGALGGRSMGARAAVMAAKEATLAKPIRFVLVSYPLQAPKGGLRDQILFDLPAYAEVLFIIGSKDKMCNLGLLEEVRRKMRARSWLVVVRGADHGMIVTPKKATAATGEVMGRIAAEWLKARDESRTIFEIEFDEQKGEVECRGWQQDPSVSAAAEGTLAKGRAKEEQANKVKAGTSTKRGRSTRSSKRKREVAE